MSNSQNPLTLPDLSNIPLSRLKGIGPKKESSLNSLDIFSVLDILTHFPRRYIDRTNEAKISSLQVGEEGMILVEILNVYKQKTRNRRSLVTAKVTDQTGNVTLTFFNQPWREKQLKVGTEVIIFGKLDQYRGEYRMVNPVVDLIGDKTGKFIPVYAQSGKAGLSTWEFCNWTKDALDKSKVRGFAEPLPSAIREQYDLVSRDNAYSSIHNPKNLGEMLTARKRLVFDELLRIQLLLLARKRQLELATQGISHDFSGDLVNKLIESLPFEPTNAQSKAIAEIFQDLRASYPMHRLLQGDVGSGKTLVAIAALLSVVEAGKQGSIMAPTEVLAEQHFVSAKELLGSFILMDSTNLLGKRKLNISLLTSQTSEKDAKEIRAKLRRGEIDIIVGTHSLIQESVEFADIGLAVVDEQHRFGVDQRAALRNKGNSAAIPDLLVMTATPIPRTAAMTVYGDLDVSILNELPEGRIPVETRRVADTPELWKEVKAQILEGRQVFIVCPLIDESENIDTTSAEATYHRLKDAELREMSVGLLHGRMHPSEKQNVMDSFRNGELNALVSTTVIEVGVNIPNATAMVILGAERFGIAQLHQLRGRVGRGSFQSICYLVSNSHTSETDARLQALVDSNDGFHLAEIDLELRGEGTVMGAEQKGRTDLRIASLRRDKEWVSHARNAANALLDLAQQGEDISLLIEEMDLFFKEEKVEYLFKS
ncbi:MAG: ATP-dependent DNA helicase RecG [Acidimicrobiales bacterium]|nr:ATP-dependent DNA helicase RecG [Acidimicrobiaceae bacterium]GIS39184.1 MAG: ATP-dependent DNA helicase RecG [Acidimicrobiales bacterium]|tara:strand:- start:4584 stop:6713 length:2130 start_codon:yes stop_codon:yes gene_type:complete